MASRLLHSAWHSPLTTLRRHEWLTEIGTTGTADATTAIAIVNTDVAETGNAMSTTVEWCREERTRSVPGSATMRRGGDARWTNSGSGRAADATTERTVNARAASTAG